MNREDAANILDLKTRPEALADFVGPELAGVVHQAMRMGAEALRSPWVKTADRLPTERETRNGVVVISGGQGWFSVQSPKVLEMYPQYYPYWMAIPNLPKVAP